MENTIEPTTPAAGPATKALDEIAANASAEPREEAGVLHRAGFLVQCLGCGEMITGELVNDNPELMNELPTEELGCPTCTAREGRPVVIPIMAASGVQVAAVEELWERESPVPPAPPHELTIVPNSPPGE